jgi:uncharacterized protein
MPSVGRRTFYAIDKLIDNIETVAGSVTSAFHDQTVRIGVTGLAGAGKTVFITSLVHNLLTQKRLPLFSPLVGGQIEAVMLTPQSDQTIPRFALERHLDDLTAKDPRWPESTSQLSQIRVTLKYRPSRLVTRNLTSTRLLHLDFVDYPGEWLLDLPLMDMSYEEWCKQIQQLITEEPRKSYAENWIQACQQLQAASRFDERAVEALADKFRSFLLKCKTSEHRLSNLQPGRFILPGDMAGSPALTFSPLLDFEKQKGDDVWSYRRIMKDRFESYKKNVVKPFFKNHFANLDRQFVLVDLLGAIEAGSSSVKELEGTLDQVMQAYRPGKLSWLSSLLLGKRISHLYFAASKADLLPRDQQQKLGSLLRSFARAKGDRSLYLGAQIDFGALAAIRATEAAEIKQNGQVIDAIVGRSKDKAEKSVIFPGDIPTDLRDLRNYEAGDFTLPRLAPPTLTAIDQGGIPHIGLDRALDFLLKDAIT